MCIFKHKKVLCKFLNINKKEVKKLYIKKANKIDRKKSKAIPNFMIKNKMNKKINKKVCAWNENKKDGQKWERKKKKFCKMQPRCLSKPNMQPKCKCTFASDEVIVRKIEHYKECWFIFKKNQSSS